MSSEKGRILEKIRKLLARSAEGRGNSEAEMNMAMEQAMKLAAQHSIDLSSVTEGETKKGIEVDRVAVKTSSKNERPYHNEIMRVLSACFGVKCVTYAYRNLAGKRQIVRVEIVGEKMDLAIAEYAWYYLEGIFPQCWTEHSKKPFVNTTFSSYRSYYMGLAQGLIEANKRVVEQMSTEDRSKYSLVLVDKNALVAAKYNELYPDVRMRSTHQRNFDSSAYSGGYAKGKTMKISQPLKG